MPTAAAMLPRVLVVARWYPSHDQPGRGSFVADLVAALAARGAAVVVASFEATHVRGVAETRPERGARAAAAIGAAIDGPAARGGLNRPHSWGAAGVPVSRLPVFLDGDRRRPDDVAAAHAAALIPFGLALAGVWPFDVIHAHTGLVDGTAALRLAEAVGRPLLVTEHSSTAAGELGDPEAAALYRQLLGGAAAGPPRRTVAVSRSLAGAIGSALGISPGTIDVLPNAVPIEGFPLGPDGDRDPDALLFVGSRKASKGIERLLRAVAMARAERPQLRLRLIGPPGTAEEEVAWGTLVAELGLTGAIRVEPAAPRVEVAAAMRRAGLFVHPSPRETFGMVVAEALASGLPVVTTPSGGGDEIVGADGRYGETADSFEPEALAAAILRTHGRSRRPEDAVARRAHVEARYAAPAVAERTVGIYRELIAAAGVVGGAPPATTPSPALPSPDQRTAAVIALARGQAVQRFDLLPPALRRATTMFTIPPAPAGLNAAQLPPEGTWHEADPRREALHPGELARRLRDAVGGSGWLVGLDADDVLAAGPALGDAVALAPGALRWLADRWDEMRENERRD